MTPAAFRACMYSSYVGQEEGPGPRCAQLPSNETLLHAGPRTSIWWQIMGLLQKSTSGLGTVSVSGRRRVPGGNKHGSKGQQSLQPRPCCCPRLSPQHLTISTDKDHGLHPADTVCWVAEGRGGDCTRRKWGGRTSRECKAGSCKEQNCVMDVGEGQALASVRTGCLTVTMWRREVLTGWHQSDLCAQCSFVSGAPTVQLN